MFKNEVGYIKSDDYLIYYKMVGNTNGIPVVFLHGGPGSGFSSKGLTFFNLNKYLVILFDQRGCGESKPKFSLKNNDTFSLLKDIENIRKFFNISKWIVFGGSWGSTLSLVYAINYPQNVIALFLRGIFLGTRAEWDWLFEKGCHQFYCDFFQEFENFVPPKYRSCKIGYYYHVLTGNDYILKNKAAFLWFNWEMINCTLNLPHHLSQDFNINYQLALLESHYATNNSFLSENYILSNCYRIKKIKTFIFQGRYDLVCPPINAFKLSQELMNCQLTFVGESGHSPFEKELFKKIKKSLDEFKID